ncbi:hypothetical protein F511_21080 [Dorcoceras hygrometricum]|uniref:Uncharacterized protein n=1 Tax=Dorcoceras hygrometricum TaxID=472368 RepID=A0A2Z7CFM8_9LAMI|nr:hypothetical protein F511_21080 [Dorcoceras hygrometricum]
MPPRRRGRGRRQFVESAGQNEDRRSARSCTRVSDEEEAEVAAPPVERMDVVIPRFQTGLKPRPAVEPGFPENNATKKQTKPRRDMGSNPNTESNNTTEITKKQTKPRRDMGLNPSTESNR